MTFKFGVTLKFSRRHCNLKPKRFDFFIEYKPADRTCPFHYQRLELFGLLEQIGIKLSVAFFKVFQYIISLSCYAYSANPDQTSHAAAYNLGPHFLPRF